MVVAAGTITTTPPIVHAFGGGLGSALALLLLYPLERARVELQAAAATSTTGDESSSTDDRPSSDAPIGSSGGRKSRDADVPPTPSSGSKEVGVKGIGPSSVDTADSLPADAADPGPEGNASESFQLVESLESSSSSLFEESDQSNGSSSEHEPPPSIPSSAAAPSSSSTLPRVNLNRTVPTSSRPERGSRIWQCIVRLHQRGELYKGVGPVVSTLGVSNFVFFYALQVSRRLISSPGGNVGGGRQYSGAIPTSPMGKSLLASSLAGIANVLITNPMWVASTRMQGSAQDTRKRSSSSVDDAKKTDADRGLWSEMRHITQEEGLSQLWNGTAASLLLVSNPAIQHFAYERLKSGVLARKRRRRTAGTGIRAHPLPSLSPGEAFVFGAVAKALATVVTYPLQLAQVLLRLQKRRGVDKGGRRDSEVDLTLYSGTFDCLVQLYRTGGFSAMFEGMNAKLLQTVLTAAFTFLTYEQILAAVQRSYFTLLYQG